MRRPHSVREDNVVVFSPLAWMKLMFFLHAGGTEVGGFALSSEHDPLYVDDFVTVRQLASLASVEFDDAAVADFFDGCVDGGLKPERFGRIWCHTHPGESPSPSSTDEMTFSRVFGHCDWALMFIVSRTHRTYARLAFRAGPGGQVLLAAEVDWSAWPRWVLENPGLWEQQLLEWAAEYEQNVYPAMALKLAGSGTAAAGGLEQGQGAAGWWDFEEYDPRLDPEFEPAAEPQWMEALKITTHSRGGEGQVPA
jgi:hypothetical protein